MSNAVYGTIESGIPVSITVPVSNRPKSKYRILGELEVGQSVLFDAPNVQAVSPGSAQYQGRDGRRYTRRKVKEGVRIWRVA